MPIETTNPAMSQPGAPLGATSSESSAANLRLGDESAFKRFGHGALPDIAPLPPPNPESAPPGGAPAATPVPATPFGSRFGRILRANPQPASDEALHALANAMSSEADDPTPEVQPDDEENTDIDAGYTYLGQFIDHDLTFDPVASLQSRRNPEDTTNFRTPRFDLDCLYGTGPRDQPYMYDATGMYLIEGVELDASLHAIDLPRAGNGRAIIGDPRNDENRIVAQLHATMIQLHNQAVNRIRATKPGTPSRAEDADAIFERAREQVRWHYQYVVVHDFLKTIVDHPIVDDVLAHGNRLFDLAGRTPFIPIEFSGAAYRFGHSMVRPSYRLNEKQPERRPIFPDLLGFRPITPAEAIDWRFFFALDPKLDPTSGFGKGGSRLQRTSGRPEKPLQKAYKIDSKVVFPMTKLPKEVTPSPSSIVERNLRRGRQFAIASAQQALADFERLGVPIVNVSPRNLLEDLRVGKANESYHDLPSLAEEIVSAGAPATAAARLAEELKRSTPLWYYVLLEAQRGFIKRLDGDVVQNDGMPVRLRGIGGRIVAEVFIGLLRADPTSYLRQPTPWTPKRGVFAATDAFGIKELIRIARP